MYWTDQDSFLSQIKDEKRFGIFLDMGVGKTSLLLALMDYKFFQDVKKVLIITPKQVSLSTWQNEIEKWDNFRYMKSILVLLDGDDKQRREKLQKTTENAIHIISSSLTEWLYGKRVKRGKVVKTEINHDTPEYDLIIVDECSQFKDPSTRRFKALKKLATKQLFLLSGTPFSNIIEHSDHYQNADELYYAMNLLGMYQGTVTQFRNDFCYTVSWDKYNYKMKKEIYNTLTQHLMDYSIRKKLDMNVQKTEHVIYCDIDIKAIKTLKNDYYIETKQLQHITASNKAIMINKALQVSNGFAYDEQSNVVRLNDYKYKRLKTLLNEIDDNVIIFYNFKEDKEYLLTHLNGAVEYDDSVKEKWNNKEIKYLILSPFSSKYGLNLQDGGHTIIWFGLVWSAESYEQANARLFRRGQQHDVDIYYLIAKNSFDQYVYDKLVAKTKTIDDFISYTEEQI